MRCTWCVYNVTVIEYGWCVPTTSVAMIDLTGVVRDIACNIVYAQNQHAHQRPMTLSMSIILLQTSGNVVQDNLCTYMVVLFFFF